LPRIDEELVARLVAEQFPDWAGQPVAAVSPQGWDNRTFRLGDELSVRLPSAAGYAPQVRKEQRWLPHLAAHLPVPIPEPVALGRPGLGYPFAWSVSGWLDGDVLSGVHDLDVTAAGAAEVLDAALASRWEREPVWFHGDFAVDNVLLRGGRVSAVLDFGCAGVGDPACDLAIAFVRFDRRSRQVFRQGVDLDDNTWRRARGWSAWKAAITLADPASPPPRQQESRHALRAVLHDSTIDR
jgi:aminoglycoside phosphotransferase (APT) family kinase protein